MHLFFVNGNFKTRNGSGMSKIDMAQLVVKILYITEPPIYNTCYRLRSYMSVNGACNMYALCRGERVNAQHKPV